MVWPELKGGPEEAPLKLAERMGRLSGESAFEVSARAEALARQGRRIVNLGIGQPDFEPPAHVIEAALKALRDGPHGYAAPGGILPLREAIAADIERRTGAALDPGQVVVVPGAKLTIFFAMLVFGEPGAEILYPDPGFPIYRSAIEFSGALPVAIPLREENGFSLNAGEVLERITPRTRLLIVNSPGNPTGGVTAPEEIHRLVEGLARHPEVAVLSDEIYGRLIYGGRKHASLIAFEPIRDRLVLLDGFSKTYAMTGWRLGYGVWPKALVDAALRLAVNSYSCVNVAAQQAGIAALTGPQDSVERMREAFDERRRLILAELNRIPGIRCAEPWGAFYAMPNITGTGLGAQELQNALLEEAGVAVIAGTSFGGFGEGYLRFSYAADAGAIREAMARIREFLQTRD